MINYKCINSISLVLIAGSIISFINIYQSDLKKDKLIDELKDELKDKLNYKKKDELSNELKYELSDESKNKIYELKKREEDLKIKETLYQESLKKLKIREEVIVNMENAFSKKNDQLTLLIDSINNFSIASDKIVKACDDNFCVIK